MVAYHQPTTLEDALRILAADNVTVLAGGTDVYPAKATRAGWGSMSHPDVLDLTRIPGLRGIADRGDHWWIGALTTWSDIARAPLPPLFDGLKAAAREIGGIQIQNRGTIGGNICTASPAGDSIPCLLALDAEVECVGGTPFRVPLAQFITGYRKTVLDVELVTGLRIPKANGRGHFLKLGARRYLVISIAMVAATFEFETRSPSPLVGEGRGRGDAVSWLSGTRAGPFVTRARIAVGACSAIALRLHNLESDLVGNPLDAALVTDAHLAHLAPIDDVRASGAYRKVAALQLVRDVIAEAARSAAS